MVLVIGSRGLRSSLDDVRARYRTHVDRLRFAENIDRCQNHAAQLHFQTVANKRGMSLQVDWSVCTPRCSCLG